MTEQLVEEFKKITEELISLFESKQKDYGSGNISTFGELGVLVRSYDKVERLRNLLFVRKQEPNNESLEDTWKDLATYAIIALLVRRGAWEGKEIKPVLVQPIKQSLDEAFKQFYNVSIGDKVFLYERTDGQIVTSITPHDGLARRMFIYEVTELDEDGSIKKAELLSIEAYPTE